MSRAIGNVCAVRDKLPSVSALIDDVGLAMGGNALERHRLAKRSTLLRCSPLPLLFRQPSPAIISSTANRKLGRLHCFGTTSLHGSALWRSAALPGHDHPCRTLATGRGFAEPTSAGSHCHEIGGMTSISSGEIIYNQSVGWPRNRPSVTRPPSERLDQAAPTFPAQTKAGRALHGGLFRAIESTTSFAIVVFSTPHRSDILRSPTESRHNFFRGAV